MMWVLCIEVRIVEKQKEAIQPPSPKTESTLSKLKTPQSKISFSTMKKKEKYKRQFFLEYVHF